MEDYPRPTAAEYVAMYKGKVSESEAVMMALIEADYPNWDVFPHPGYPDTREWMCRRHMTSMPEPLRRPGLAEIPSAIDQWNKEHNPYGYRALGNQR
ncbi:MAG TPA: hypothetical protein VMV92_13735 [Streptosporangiaceae bacterium]|nr:hypothetical protein [Streptosporangiaceae bacterium]